MTVTVRRARPADAAAVAQVHVRSWQAGYRGLLPATGLNALDPAEWARRYTFDVVSPVTSVAVEGGTIVGLATVSTSADEGELWALYVDPTHWGTGVGTALLSAAQRILVDAGFSSARLWVLRGNTRATRFYAAHGWAPDGEVREDEWQGFTLHEERFVRTLPDR